MLVSGVRGRWMMRGKVLPVVLSVLILQKLRNSRLSHGCHAAEISAAKRRRKSDMTLALKQGIKTCTVVSHFKLVGSRFRNEN